MKQPKQDRNGARTAVDLERKYPLGDFERDESDKQELRRLIAQGQELFDKIGKYISFGEGRKTPLSFNSLSNIALFSHINKDGVYIGNIKMDIPTIKEETDLISLFYPVGTIYRNINNVDPNKLFGGEWQAINSKPGYAWKRIK